MDEYLPTKRLHVEQETILRYAALTEDFNPVHVDPDFARATPMGGLIAHGTIALNLLVQALELYQGAKGQGALSLEIRFRSPVRPGEIIEAGGTRLSGSEEWQVWVKATNGREVIGGTATTSGKPDGGVQAARGTRERR